jgi:hypothetical protein
MRDFAGVLSIAVAATLVGCSDGAGSTSAGPTAMPPSPAIYDYFGVVGSGELGPVWIDQCRSGSDPTHCFERVTIDGAPASSKAVQTGHIVRMRSTSGWNVAVDIHHAAVGAIDAIDWHAGTATVLGQRVLLYTSPDWRDYTLAVGDRVSVSGFFTATGDIHPTLIGTAHHAEDAVRGVLQRDGSGFRIGGLAVDLTAASASGFPASAVLPGDAVRVVGRRDAPGLPLDVTTIEYIGGDFPAAGTTVWQLQGFVTAARTAADFDVAGQRALVGNCSCGWFSGPLPVGAQVSVRAGAVATGLTIVSPANVEGHNLVGPIERIDAAAGTLTVLGFTARLQDTTFIMGTDTRLSTWKSDGAAIAVGEWVSLTVRRAGDELLAALITRPLRNEPSIASWDAELDDPVVRVFGQPISTDSTTTIAFCEGACGHAEVSKLFSATMTPYTYLEIYLASPEPPLRAVRIHPE